MHLLHVWGLDQLISILTQIYSWSPLLLQTLHWRTLKPWEGKFSGLIRQSLYSSAECKVSCLEQPGTLITWPIPSLLWTAISFLIQYWAKFRSMVTILLPLHVFSHKYYKLPLELKHYYRQHKSLNCSRCDSVYAPLLCLQTDTGWLSSVPLRSHILGS